MPKPRLGKKIKGSVSGGLPQKYYTADYSPLVRKGLARVNSNGKLVLTEHGKEISAIAKKLSKIQK